MPVRKQIFFSTGQERKSGGGGGLRIAVCCKMISYPFAGFMSILDNPTETLFGPFTRKQEFDLQIEKGNPSKGEGVEVRGRAGDSLQGSAGVETAPIATETLSRLERIETEQHQDKTRLRTSKKTLF